MNFLFLLLAFSAFATDRVSFVTTAPDAFAVRSGLIENEHEEILADLNIAETTGRAGEILARLCNRARAGVRVRLITDGMSADFWKTGGLNSSFATAMHSSCGSSMEVRFWNPVSMKTPFDYLKSHKVRRDHDKIMVFKSQNTVYTGDRNSQNVNFATDYTYFSIDAVVEGQAARDAYAYVDSVWNQCSPLARIELKNVPLDRGKTKGDTNLANAEATRALTAPLPPLAPAPHLNWIATSPQFLHFDPAARLKSKPTFENDFNAQLVSLVKSAQHELILSTPYLRLPPELFDAIRARRDAGVAVTLVTSKASSRLLPKVQIQNHDVNRLKKIGVVLLQKASSDDLHAKVIVADGARAWMGSHNLNMRGSFMDLEAGLLFDHPQAVNVIRDFALAETEPYVARPSSLKTKLLEGLLGICSYCRKQF